MTTLATTDNRWTDLARRLFDANVTALGRFHGSLGRDLKFPTEYFFTPALDGSLTAITPERQWWRTYAVPQRAAEAWLRPLQHTGTMACLLAPQHPSVVDQALRQLPATTAAIALLDDVETLPLFLSLRDFSEELTSGRLLFACSPADIGSLLRAHTGFQVPSFFVRPGDKESEPIQRLITECQAVLNTLVEERDAEAKRILANKTNNRNQTVVLTRRPVELWDIAPHVLSATMQGVPNSFGAAGGQSVVLDVSRNDTASPLKIVQTLADAGTVIAADLDRHELQSVLPAGCRCISWVTAPRLWAPAPTAVESGDHLLLADTQWAAQARAAGWPPDRIHLATWPMLARNSAAPDAVISSLLLMADVPEDLVCPPELARLSSVKLLWNTLVETLIKDPFSCLPDPTAWLEVHRKAQSISADNFNVALFLTGMVLPAYAIGLANWLVAEGHDIRLIGTGWQAHKIAGAQQLGPLKDYAELVTAANSSTALVHVSPLKGAHPILGLGRPVIGTEGGPSQFRSRLAQLGRLSSAPNVAAGPPLGCALRELFPVI